MEKLLTRSLLSRNQVVSKKRRKIEQEIRRSWREYNRTRNTLNTEFNNLVKNERRARREDWMLGPLAPKRDVGENKDTFGAVHSLMAQTPKLPKNELIGPSGQGYYASGAEDERRPGFENREWKGEGLMGNLVEGDRVCVVKGRMGVAGKIGKVTKIEPEARSVYVKGVNLADVKVPAAAEAGAYGRKIFEQEMPIPISDLRLVITQQHKETGKRQDVIVNHVYGAGPYEQRPYGSSIPRHTRYVKFPDGQKAVIPWPEQETDRQITQSTDTVRNLVEEVTYQPSLNVEMPTEEGVIDELRFKHSRSRRDWDDLELLRKKMMIDARKDWFEARSQMLSQPFWTKEFMARAKKDREVAEKQQAQQVL